MEVHAAFSIPFCEGWFSLVWPGMQVHAASKHGHLGNANGAVAAADVLRRG
jgi:hypothetical protein